MRKHKSVVAILLAVMMIFTFMPAMVFAADYSFTVKSWDDSATGKYGSVVGKCTVTTQADQTFTTNRAFSSDSDTHPGLITAVPQSKTSGIVGGDTYNAPNSSAYFYDFDGAKLVYRAADGKYKELNGTSFLQDTVRNTDFYVELVEPEYSSDAVAAKEAEQTYKLKKAHVKLQYHHDYDSETNEHSGTYTANFGSWTLTIKRDVIDYNTKKEQSINFTVDSFVPSGAVNPVSASTADKFGTIDGATIKVLATAPTPQNATFYLDEVGKSLSSGVYDGNVHTVVADAVSGWNLSYEVLNPTTGRYEAKDSVTITDVQKNPVNFRAVFTDGKGNEVKRDGLSVNLSPVGPSTTASDSGRNVYFGFDMSASEDDSSAVYTVPATEYDSLSYVAFVAQEKDITGATTEAQAAVKKANDGVKSAVEKNAENLKNWFNDYYTIKDVTTKAQAKNNEVHVEINSKAGSYTKAEAKALAEKYEGLVRNFGTGTLALSNNKFVKTTATIKLNGDASKDSEVTFTNAISSKTYSKKKTTKKGALKKDQTIQFTAKAANGKTVVYKLVNVNTKKIKIDSNTGVLTLKKGLKGKYSFQVKAYVPTTGVSYAYELQNVTIKIKK